MRSLVALPNDSFERLLRARARLTATNHTHANAQVCSNPLLLAAGDVASRLAAARDCSFDCFSS